MAKSLLLLCALALAALGLYRFQTRAEPPTVAALTMDHAAIRLRDIDTEIATLKQPSVIVVGDSITEEAAWPKNVCGRILVNGGVGTADTARVSALMHDFHWLHYQPEMIVIATGMNDAHKGQWSEDAFHNTYQSIVSEALTVTPEVMVATVTPVDYEGPVGRVIDPNGRDVINKEIRDIAKYRNLTVIDLDAVKSLGNLTRDGVHGTPEGNKAFADEVTGAIKTKLKCS